MEWNSQKLDCRIVLFYNLSDQSSFYFSDLFQNQSIIDNQSIIGTIIGIDIWNIDIGY